MALTRRSKKYKMIRIPEDEYDDLVKAKREVLRKGLEGLPAEVVEDEEGDEAPDFTMGLLVGLGAAALVYLLTHKNQGGNR